MAAFSFGVPGTNSPPARDQPKAHRRTSLDLRSASPWRRHRSDFLLVVALASLALSLPTFFESAWRLSPSRSLLSIGLWKDGLDHDLGPMKTPQNAKARIAAASASLLSLVRSEGYPDQQVVVRATEGSHRKSSGSPIVPQICQPGNFTVPWSEFQEAAADAKLAFLYTPYHVTTGGGEKYLLTG